MKTQTFYIVTLLTFLSVGLVIKHEGCRTFLVFMSGVIASEFVRNLFSAKLSVKDKVANVR